MYDAGKWKPLLDLCKTRWAERHNAYQHYYQAYVCLHCRSFKNDWLPISLGQASMVVYALTGTPPIAVGHNRYTGQYHNFQICCCSFNCVPVSICISSQHHYCQGTEESQWPCGSALNGCWVIIMYKIEWVTVEAGFSQIYNHRVVLAIKVGTEASVPRIASRQQHRSNIQSVSPKEYYWLNIALSPLDVKGGCYCSVTLLGL